MAGMSCFLLAANPMWILLVQLFFKASVSSSSSYLLNYQMTTMLPQHQKFYWSWGHITYVALHIANDFTMEGGQVGDVLVAWG